jgi:hypothetical protein
MIPLAAVGYKPMLGCLIRVWQNTGSGEQKNSARLATPRALRETVVSDSRKELYRAILAEPPWANARTWSRLAIVVSPGKVVSSAPCAQPRRTASSGDAPVSSP